MRITSLLVAPLLLSSLATPATAQERSREYPWCLSRESYLYCSYATEQQCRWTASGIGGCALNPRLLFPDKPRDSNLRVLVPKSR